MKQLKRCMTALIAGLACWLDAAEPAGEDAQMGYEVDAVITESTLCEQGAIDPENAIKALFTKSAADKWNAFTGDDFSQEQLRDFFCGAFILRGPVSEKGGIAGFYNPWWDAILITESYLTKISFANDSNGMEEGEIRQIGDFVFLSGASFREDKGSDTAVAEKLASPKGSPSEIVLELTSRTQKQFETMYGKMKVPLLLDHPGAKSESSKKQIIACAGIRLKMTHLLLNDKTRYEDIWSIAKILRTGKRDTFDLLFPSEFGKMMTRTFCRLPEDIRADFEPYGYYPDKNGGKARVYLFINTQFPRLFAVASLGLGADKNVFEWYDFAQCDELVKAFEMAKKEEAK